MRVSHHCSTGFAKRDVAIVTEEAGRPATFWNCIWILKAIPVTMIDTAGLRHSDNVVEREGIRRAREKSENADLLIEVVDVPPQGMSVLLLLHRPHGWSCSTSRIESGRKTIAQIRAQE